MYDYRKFYINGEWVPPAEARELDVINPATEKPIGKISLGSSADVDKAVAAAKAAFATYSQTTVQQRADLLQAILAAYQKRMGEIAKVISEEMGAPMKLAMTAQAPSGLAHFMTTLNVLKKFPFEETRGRTILVREPIGVCGLITPWNWPINQIACKVAPALAAGCTMVLKPSEVAPFNACLFAEILHEAGVPKGVFNLVNGDGPGVGTALSTHPDIDMISFTGSTRAGKLISKAAADTVKRVALELGGKSANIIVDDDAFPKAVAGGVKSVFTNSGQSCNAPTRMLVPERRMNEAVEIAREAAAAVKPGAPGDAATVIGPVVSETQWKRIEDLIQKGIDEGATLVCGGTGKPEGLSTGYYVKPTVFANVRNDMTIAREEVFGPVLAIIPYKDDADAIRIANDTPYGLSGYVSSADKDRALRIARSIRSGNVHVNGAGPDFASPFGGYKQSGNGREWGDKGLEEYLEIKAILT